MKKLWLVLFLLVFTSAQAAESINCTRYFTAGFTLAAGATTYVNVSEGSEGYFSVQPVFTGTGTLKIGYQVSNNGIDWSPEIQIIATSASSTVYPYPAEGVNNFAGFQRLVFTETGSANNVIISGVYRCAQ